MEKKFLGETGLARLLTKLTETFSKLGHKHTKSEITDFPTIPTKTSELTNDSGFKTTDNNTTYQLTKSGSTIILIGSDGKNTTVEDDNTEISVDSALSSSSTNPVQNKVINSALNGKVPTSRTVNGKALSANITLSASDVGADASGSAADALTNANSYTDEKVGVVADDLSEHTGRTDNPHGVTASQIGAVPTTRKVNNKSLSSNITLSASDVGADASGTASSAVSGHNTSTDAHSDIRELITGLTTRLNTLANSTDEDLDQMAEIVEYIKANKTLIDSITTSKVNVADIVNNLTTNVATKPLSAAQGVAIKALIDALQTEVDKKALASDLTSHTDNSTIHITSTERTNWNDANSKKHSHSNKSVLDGITSALITAWNNAVNHISDAVAHITAIERANWNAAKTHADSAHAPSGAEVNQNAFSNVKVGTTTIAADSKTDTLELVGSNVTITPDTTNNKVTLAVADGTTSAKGVVQLTNSTSSTSTTTAATPSSVKSAYDLANTAKTNAATAQSKADSAYDLAESKVDSLSDLGVTATAAELNYVDGVTSNIQTQLDKKVTLDTNQTITGVKTFNAPANVANTEQTTVKFKTSNGGAVIFGKERANNGTMMRLDQADGTVRLRFRGSNTAGAMVWEQPEQGAQLYVDLGKEGIDKRRITFPSKAGTLALTTAATTAEAGLMSASDKSKLDGITTGANKYIHPAHTARTAGLYKITVDSQGHVTNATAVVKSDITALGIPSTNTTYDNATSSANGLMPSTDKAKLDGMEIATVSEVETYLGI